MHSPVLLSILHPTKSQNPDSPVKYRTPGNPIQYMIILRDSFRVLINQYNTKIFAQQLSKCYFQIKCKHEKFPSLPDDLKLRN